jgi:hypothetical protein
MFADPLTINANNFIRVGEGNFIYESSSLDEPNILSIKSDLKETGTSSFVIERSFSVNSVDGPDKTLRVYTVVRGDFNIFTNAQVMGLHDDVAAMFDDAHLTRIRRGER